MQRRAFRELAGTQTTEPPAHLEYTLNLRRMEPRGRGSISRNENHDGFQTLTQRYPTVSWPLQTIRRGLAGILQTLPARHGLAGLRRLPPGQDRSPFWEHWRVRRF